jgi:hypothetical protein
MFKRVMKHLLSLIEKVRGSPSSTHLFPSLICWSHETLSLSLYVRSTHQEKQSESLMEKLCHRLRTAKGTKSLLAFRIPHMSMSPPWSMRLTVCGACVAPPEEEQEDIAYCLTLLNYSEKALRRLIELEKCYSAALINPGVLDHFFVLVGKVRTSFAPSPPQGLFLERKQNSSPAVSA